MSKAEEKRVALESWWSRDAWPCVLLSVDPGSTSGATVIDSGKLVACENGDIYRSRFIEDMLQLAIETAAKSRLRLVLATEGWTAGGRLGIEQWIGLGASLGCWKREFSLAATTNPNINLKDKVSVHPQRWRSRIIGRNSKSIDGKTIRFESQDWKEEARKEASNYFFDYIPKADAAESCCLAIYAMRSDEVMTKLGARYLSKFGYTDLTELEEVITGPKKKKGRKRS